MIKLLLFELLRSKVFFSLLEKKLSYPAGRKELAHMLDLKIEKKKGKRMEKEKENIELVIV